jgi:hypothetical protein
MNIFFQILTNLEIKLKYSKFIIQAYFLLLFVIISKLYLENKIEKSKVILGGF